MSTESTESTALADPAVERVGIRALRSNVADLVRRAGTGERITVTVDGRPVARLGPLAADGPIGIDDLVAAGLAWGAERFDRPPPPEPVDLPVDARVDDVLADQRGR